MTMTTPTPIDTPKHTHEDSQIVNPGAKEVIHNERQTQMGVLGKVTGWFTNIIDKIMPDDLVLLTSSAGLCSVFNLIGRMVNNYLMTIVSTPTPCLSFIGFSRAWTVLQCRKKIAGNGYTNLIGTGLFLSAIGDVLMGWKAPTPAMGQKLFAAGLGAFFIVQILNSIAFTYYPPVTKDPKKQAKRAPLRLTRAIPFALFGALWWNTTKDHLPATGPMRYGILAYIIIELFAGWRAAARVGMPGANPALQLGALSGMILFTACDSMIGYKMFVYNQASALTTINMSLYWTGQMLIALSANEMLTLPEIAKLFATSGPDADVL